jgi:nucleoside-diphosphate-sugar epimerase
VLVTGATGFIGRRVLGPLQERGFDVHAVARTVPNDPQNGVTWLAADLLDDAQRRGVVQRAGATHLLHLAWYAEHGRFWEAAENVAWTAATLRLAQEFAAAGGRRAVMAGTCAEYAWGSGGMLAENATALEPATLYGACKDATRRIVARLVPELAWGRVFFLYGPGERRGRLVAAVARALVAGERAPTSAGGQRRDFLHADDVADAFAALVASDVTGAVNVGSGAPVAVADVVRTIAACAGRPELLDVGALPQRAGEPEEIVADVRRLRDEVGWAPRIGLAEGLASTVDWWRAQAR